MNNIVDNSFKFAFISFLLMTGSVFVVTTLLNYFGMKMIRRRIDVGFMISCVVSSSVFVLLFSMIWAFDVDGNLRTDYFLDAVDYYSVLVLNLWISLFLLSIALIGVVFLWVYFVRIESEFFYIGIALALLVVLLPALFFLFQILSGVEESLLSSVPNFKLYRVWLMENPRNSIVTISALWGLTNNLLSSLGLSVFISKFINFLIWLGGLIQGAEYLFKFLRKISKTTSNNDPNESLFE